MTKAEPIPCGFCPKMIIKAQEARGRLYMLGGRPICVACRVLNGAKGAHIRHDRKDSKVKNEVLERAKEQKAQDEADIHAAAVAEKSQKDTNTSKE